MNQRLKLFQVILQKNHLDGLLISHQPNITYLTGFLSSDSYLLLTPKQNFFITDSRYYQQVKAHLKKINIQLADRSIFKTIIKIIDDSKIKRLGFEARNLDVAQYQLFKKSLRCAQLIPTHNLIEEPRQIKSAEESSKIRTSVRIAAQALKYAQRIIKPGVREIELAAELERFIRYRGGRTASFETIVASGRNSAFVHHQTSRQKIKQNNCVLIDIGVDFAGYKSDLTRTFFLGRIPSEYRKIYRIVYQAKSQAIKIIKPGIRISQLDKIARQYITKHGYGGFFAHNLGHGIGLEIHEQPYIRSDNKAAVKAGMVFTIEPAVYLPGKFGIRLEDDILVTKTGCQVLNADLDK